MEKTNSFLQVVFSTQDGNANACRFLNQSEADKFIAFLNNETDCRLQSISYIPYPDDAENVIRTFKEHFEKHLLVKKSATVLSIVKS